MGVGTSFFGGGAGGGSVGPFNNALFRATPIGRLSGQTLSPRSRAFVQANNERLLAGLEGRTVGSIIGRQSELTSQNQASDISRAAQNQTLLSQIFGGGGGGGAGPRSGGGQPSGARQPPQTIIGSARQRRRQVGQNNIVPPILGGISTFRNTF